MAASKASRARVDAVRAQAAASGTRMTPREARRIARSGTASRPAVAPRDLERAIARIDETARGSYRIADGHWESRVHVNVGRTGIRFWVRAQPVRDADLPDLCAEDPEPGPIRALAQLLRSATRAAVEPIRRGCAALDLAASLSAPEEDLVFVKTAMRQLDLATTDPAEILESVRTVHDRALARSVAIAELVSNPYDLASLAQPAGVERRRILALVGPTNSGKTHAGLEMLAEAGSGAYLGPLRLMAMEQYDRLHARGVATTLRTGEESIEHPDATHLSATIEMADLSAWREVVVVDEAQLLASPDRGWAWTRALMHAPCATLVVTGSPDCLPILRRIAAITGESVEVRTHERRAPLHALSAPLELRDLRRGDAVIAFSRSNVLAVKAELSRIVNPDTGRPFRVATIYGALGPEVRRSEARRFSSGDAEILVATDAIGMGLNLPIDRVVFSSLVKFDGRAVRDLEESEIRQIGGRAGRSGQEGGFVGMLSTAGPSMQPIRTSLSRTPAPDADDRPYIWPTLEQIRAGMDAFEIDCLARALPAVSAKLRTGPDYRCHIGTETIDLLQTIEPHGLPLDDLHAWIGCPLPLRDHDNRRMASQWAAMLSRGERIGSPELEAARETEVDDHRLRTVERVVVQAGAYLWLSRRWPDAFVDADAADATRREGNRIIEHALRQRHIHRNCLECGTPIGYRLRHDTCRSCAFG